MLVYNVVTELFVFESFWFSDPSNLISTSVKEAEDGVAGIWEIRGHSRLQLAYL